MPKLNHYKKSSDPDPLESVGNLHDRENIVLVVRAVELYCAIACIAMGLLQLVALNFQWIIADMDWQRTPTSTSKPSEETIQNYLKKRLPEKILNDENNEVGKLIRSKLNSGQIHEVEKLMDVA